MKISKKVYGNDKRENLLMIDDDKNNKIILENN